MEQNHSSSDNEPMSERSNPKLMKGHGCRGDSTKRASFLCSQNSRRLSSTYEVKRI